MKLKGWVERHPLGIISVVVIATATVVAAPMQYLCSQRIELLNKSSELQARECEAQLTSIRRGLGDSKYLDIRSFIHERAQQAEIQLPPGSGFFAEDNFYGESDNQEWKHEEMTETRFLELVGGERVPPWLAKFTNDSAIHVWRDPRYSPAEGDVPFVNVGPTVTLEKSTIEKLLRSTNEGINIAAHQEQVTLSEIAVNTQNMTRAQKTEAKKRAEELHDRALKGEDFAELARHFSDGSTAKQGGLLGVYERGELSKDIQDVAFKIKAGEISDVLETKQGFLVLKVLYHSNGAQSTSDVPTEKDSGAFLAQLESEFRGDAAGHELMIRLEYLHEELFREPDFSMEIVNLQKVGNVVYAQLLQSFRNVTVGGLHYSKYYMREEIVIVSDQNYVYTIQTFVPTPDPSPKREIYSRITKWFAKLAIFVG